MAAGLGYIEFATGDVLTAAAANGYLASQVVMVFASAAARTSAIASPQEGMISYLKDTNSTEYYSGSAWVAIGGAGGASGFTYINSFSFSNVASLSMSSIFSSTYDYYRIVVDYNHSTASDWLNIRLRTGSTDNTSASYYSSTLRNDTTSVTGAYDNGATGFTRMILNGQNANIISFDITNPFSSSLPTYMNAVFGSYKSSATAKYIAGSGSGWFDGNTSFDGLTLIPNVNFTGKAKVYGYSNS